MRAMFDRIAGVYDRMNTVMTAGLHHRWRERAADLAGVGPGGRVLDVATGTGDLAIELAGRVGPRRRGRRLGLLRGDARRWRAARQPPARALVEWANALELPYADDSFDAATVGFGARNFSDLERGSAEMARVVRPGGRVVILEITTPDAPAAVVVLRAVVRPRRAAARAPGRRPRRLHLPAELGEALPRPARRSPRRWSAAACARCAGSLTAGGIIAIHVGEVA